MKTTYWIVIIVVVLAVLATALFGKEKKPSIEVRKITPEDSGVLEEWDRVTSDEDVLGVSAARLKRAKWNWQISISAAEFVRKDPLASRLQNAVMSALKKVKGVKSVVREDTEVWLVEGEASGEELVRACSGAVDELDADIRSYLKSL